MHRGTVSVIMLVLQDKKDKASVTVPFARPTCFKILKEAFDIFCQTEIFRAIEKMK